MPSKVNNSDEELSHFASNVVKPFISKVEEDMGHKRTIFCGDLNMNPYDSGVIAATGLHAVMDKNIALRQYSQVKGEKYDFMYNPVWGLMGDNGKGKE